MGKTFGWRRRVAFGKPAYKHPVAEIFGALGNWIVIGLAGMGVWWFVAWVMYWWKE